MGGINQENHLAKSELDDMQEISKQFDQMYKQNKQYGEIMEAAMKEVEFWRNRFHDKDFEVSKLKTKDELRKL